MKRHQLKALARTWGEWDRIVPTEQQKAEHPISENVSVCYSNNRYGVQVYECFIEKLGLAGETITQVTIGRHGDLESITWDELQRIKNELIGEDRVAIEIYPPVRQLVNQANLRHLWVFHQGYTLPFGLHLPTAFGRGMKVGAGA